MAFATWPSSPRRFTDVYRPAAREQLAQVAKAVGTAVWPGTGTDKPLEIVKGAIKEAKLSASDVVLVDTPAACTSTMT